MIGNTVRVVLTGPLAPSARATDVAHRGAAGRSSAVGAGSVRDVENDDSLGLVVEAVADAPVAAAAGRVLPVVLITKWVPDAERVVK